MKKRKGKRLFCIYLSAAVLTLSAFAAVTAWELRNSRLLSAAESRRAFEATAEAVGRLSETLEKSRYAEGSYCTTLCAEARGAAEAAEAALSVLPFSTVEMEVTAAFLNTVRAYAGRMCRGQPEDFSADVREDFSAMADTAAVLSQSLYSLRDRINGGELFMDERLTRLANVGQENRPMLSAGFYELEQGLSAPELQGYSPAPDGNGETAEPDARAIRAFLEALPLPEGELSPVCSYPDGSLCFSVGTLALRAAPDRLLSWSNSRLCGESTLTPEAGEERALAFLAALGVEGAAVQERREQAGVLRLTLCPSAEEVTDLGAALRMAVALDNGDILLYEAAETVGAEEFSLSEEEARSRMPEGYTAEECRRGLLREEGVAVPCYELCFTDADRRVRLYIHAESGQQQEIRIEKLPDKTDSQGETPD